MNDQKLKIIPEKTVQLLTPISLAYWIMNNGRYNSVTDTIILILTYSHYLK